MPIFVCSTCGKEYKSEKWFDTHVRECASTSTQGGSAAQTASTREASSGAQEPKQHTCAKCGQNFKTASAQRVHSKLCGVEQSGGPSGADRSAEQRDTSHADPSVTPSSSSSVDPRVLPRQCWCTHSDCLFESEDPEDLASHRAKHDNRAHPRKSASSVFKCRERFAKGLFHTPTVDPSRECRCSVCNRTDHDDAIIMCSVCFKFLHFWCDGSICDKTNPPYYWICAGCRGPSPYACHHRDCDKRFTSFKAHYDHMERHKVEGENVAAGRRAKKRPAESAPEESSAGEGARPKRRAAAKAIEKVRVAVDGDGEGAEASRDDSFENGAEDDSGDEGGAAQRRSRRRVASEDGERPTTDAHSVLHPLPAMFSQARMPESFVRSASSLSVRENGNDRPAVVVPPWEGRRIGDDLWFANAGGPVTAAEWAPVPDGSPVQYFAVATRKDVSERREVRRHEGPGVVQIWCVEERADPFLAMAIVHDNGHALGLAWCPLNRAPADVDAGSNGALPRIGLLAVAFSAGAVAVYAVPRMGAATNERRPQILRVIPAKMLCVPDAIPTCVAWSATGSVVYAGCDDGHVAVFRLRPPESQGGGLVNPVTSRIWAGDKVLPVSRVRAHRCPVRCVAASPFDDNQIASSGYEPHVRVWNVEDACEPAAESVAATGFPADMTWESGQHVTIASEEGSRIVSFADPKHVVAGTATRHVTGAWSVSSGPLQLVASGGCDGSVRLSDTRRSRFKLSYVYQLVPQPESPSTVVWSRGQLRSESPEGNEGEPSRDCKVFPDARLFITRVRWNGNAGQRNWLLSASGSGFVRGDLINSVGL